MPFLTRNTFDYRCRLMREMMDANRLDALAFTSSDFFQWATNLHVDVQTWERPIVAVVPRDGEAFAIMNELSTNHLRGAMERGTMWVGAVTIYSEHLRLGRRVPLRAQWAEVLVDCLRERGLGAARVGVESAGGPLARAATLSPELIFVPCLQQMRALRFVKCG